MGKLETSRVVLTVVKEDKAEKDVRRVEMFERRVNWLTLRVNLSICRDLWRFSEFVGVNYL